MARPQLPRGDQSMQPSEEEQVDTDLCGHIMNNVGVVFLGALQEVLLKVTALMTFSHESASTGCSALQ